MDLPARLQKFQDSATISIQSVADGYERNAKIIINILNIDFIFYWLRDLILNKEDRYVQWLFFC